MDTPPDAALVTAATNGDVSAFAQLLGRYRDTCTRFALRMVGNWDDADDVLQSSFVRAYRNLGNCQDPDRFQAWFYRIVLNECRTLLARQHRQERWFQREDREALAEIPMGEVEDPEILSEELQRALDQLPVEQREAFLLKYVEEMSYEEISELTGVGVSALKMRVKRSCQRLYELLEGVLR